MTQYVAAILREWREEIPLKPGAYVVLLSDSADAGIVARRAGMHVRDTLLVMHPGPRTSFAHLLRAPLAEKSTVEQVLATGTGAIHIKACRVQTEERIQASAGPVGGYHGSPSSYEKGTGVLLRDAGYGRWPTNLVLVHGAACRSIGSKKIPGHRGYPNGPGGKSYQYSSSKRGAEVRPNAWAGHADPDGTETIAEYECEPACPVGRMNAMSGERPATLTGRADPEEGHANRSSVVKPGIFGVSGHGIVYADSGGAARYYVQVADESELMGWLLRLIKPPTGQVLFAV